MSGAKETLLEFPCDFPIKIMGLAEPGFADAVVEVVIRHAPDYDPVGTGMRASSRGKYVSLTCVIRAESKSQLDALYTELSRHPLVKVVL
jgi:uncharacterized protein